MNPNIYAALVHHPVLDRRGDTVTTSITTLDIHDIARSARTYGLRGYYLVTPVEPQHYLVNRVIEHWGGDWGSEYNPTRGDALGVVRLAVSLEAAADDIEAECGTKPLLVATSARQYPSGLSFGDLRQRMDGAPDQPWCVVFGTGWGLHPSVVSGADFILSPVQGPTEFNHLSVRSAAAIIFDRLFGLAG